jgi:hypothetical protein
MAACGTSRQLGKTVVTCQQPAVSLAASGSVERDSVHLNCFVAGLKQSVEGLGLDLVELWPFVECFLYPVF